MRTDHDLVPVRRLVLYVVIGVALTGGLLLTVLPMGSDDIPATRTEDPPSAPPTTHTAEGPSSLVPIGAAVWTRSLDADPAFRALVAQNFDFVVAENDTKMDALQPEPGRFDFTHGDRIVDFARSHGLEMGMGHVLIWHRQLPGWVGERDLEPPWRDQPGFPLAWPWTREELIEVMRRHITEVIRHYHGQVREWNVVNEALTRSGSWRESIWYRVIGPEYVELAFRFARAADPQALLYYNDYGTEDVDHPKSRAVYRLVRDLLDKGAPIDGVGFQYHLFPDLVPIPGPASMEASLRRFARLGLRVQITELDVALPRALRGTPEAFEWQGRIYRRVARACRRVPACERFTTWGASDRHSWLSEGSDGLPFDAGLQPKPAWRAITEVLRPPPEDF